MITLTYTFNSESEFKAFLDRSTSTPETIEQPKEFFSGANRYKPWSQFETDYLISNYGLKTTKYIAHQLSRNPVSVNSKVFLLRAAGVPIKKIKNTSKNI